MKANLIDTRDAQTKAILRRIESNKEPVVILLGHKEVILSIELAKLRNIPNAKIVWIYACECGLSLVHQMSDKYDAVMGYATSVLAPATVESTVAFKLKQIIERFQQDSTPTNLVRFAQNELLDLAIRVFKAARTKGMENGLYLVQAALINHTRLSLRVAGLKINK